MGLRASDFDYALDAQLIAQKALEARSASRLMVVDRQSGRRRHKVFEDLPEMLGAGDLLILNDTRVIPAKFAGRRSTGGKIDGLFCREFEPGCWEVLLKNAGRCKLGEKLTLVGGEGLDFELAEDLGRGHWTIRLPQRLAAVEVLERVGTTPLPPYIRRPGGAQGEQDQADRRSYQTVYAAKSGAVAAPTAGLHFTEELLAELHRRGVATAVVTLHVGPGTFAPVKAEDISAHKMHREWYELSGETAEKLNSARKEGRRIVAVGTTSVRVLETVAAGGRQFAQASGWTDIFIYPPAKFSATDALITNFHLPRSTLLMLVAAFCSPGDTNGIPMILEAYAEAVRLRYRFYSYGDAMLIE